MSNGKPVGRIDALAPSAPPGPKHSGRRFVIAAVAVLLAVVAALALMFLDWRARHRELAAFGAREVGPLVDPLADRVPPGVEPKAWRAAVADSHAMLDALTASGLLDRAAVEALRDDLRTRFAPATPETALSILIRLWDDMQARAGPILTVPPSRPPFCPPRPELLGGKGGAPRREGV